MKTFVILVVLIAGIGIGIAVLVKYYIFRLGKAVNKEISNSYYYHSKKDIVVYSPDGNWFELGYVEMKADKNSFMPIADEFGKDKSAVFWRGIIQDVDYTTFSVDEDFIARDSMRVYSSIGYGEQLMVIEGANPKTYHLFDTGVDSWNRYWNRDDGHYFYIDRMIDADYNTFKRINNTLAIDTNSIYVITSENPSDGLQSKNIQAAAKKHINPQGEVKVLNGDYALIGHSVVLSNWKTEFAIIPFHSIDTMRVIDERNIIVNNQLISDGKVYDKIDVATFKAFHRDYFNDKNNVYYDGQQIEGANVETFEVVFEEYSKDGQHVYYKTEIVAKASPTSFKYDYATGKGKDGDLNFKDGKLVAKE